MLVMQTPIPTYMGRKELSKDVQRFADRHDFKPGDDLTRVVAALGGKLTYHDHVSTDAPISLRVRSLGDFTIFRSPIPSPVRTRATIAHELGHYLLHYPKVLEQRREVEMVATASIDKNDEEAYRAEIEANWFTSQLLMPAHEFSQKVGLEGLEAAITHFRVPRKFAEARAKSFGYDLDPDSENFAYTRPERDPVSGAGPLASP